MSSILYLASGRNFRSDNPVRKIESVVNVFKSLGHQVFFICGGDIIQRNKVPATSFAKSTGYKRAFHAFLRNSLSELKDIVHDNKLHRHIISNIKNDKVDLVWERSSRLHYAGLKFAAERGIPYVLEWKDNLMRYSFSFLKPWALRLEKKKMVSADHIVVESFKLAREIARKEGLPSDKFITALNAVDADEFYRPVCRERMRKEHGFKEDQFIIGYVGSFAFYHNVGMLCDVAVMLKDDHVPDDVLFVLVGDGSGRAAFDRRAAELDVNEWFHRVGKVPKDLVPKYLSMIDCAILPESTDIICPIKVQEYMAAELPVLLPDYEANREVITDRRNGLLFEPRNTAAIFKQIMALKEDVGLARRIGLEGRKTVISKLTNKPRS